MASFPLEFSPRVVPLPEPPAMMMSAAGMIFSFVGSTLKGLLEILPASPHTGGRFQQSKGGDPMSSEFTAFIRLERIAAEAPSLI
jgi:hypothetical protein